MPESSFEPAWKALRIRKAAPLAAVVPAALAGYGIYQGVQNVRQNQITDPFLGVKVAEGDDSFGSNVAEFGTGMSQGVGAGAAVKLGGKALGRLGGRKAAETVAERLAAKQAAEASTRTALAREQADAVQAEAMRQGIAGPGTLRALDDKMVADAASSGYVNSQARAAGREAYRPGAFRQGGYSALGRAGSALDQSAGRMVGVPLATGALGALGYAGYRAARGMFGGDPSMPDGENPMGRFGGQGAGRLDTAGFGQGGTGDLANVSSNATADRVIFDPTLARGNQALTGFEGQQEFGGFGVRTGENMRIGDQLLKEVNTRMHEMHLSKKDVCATCNKKDCVGKMHCMAKADKDKKPAHGMVIVIGSKAGPGPSKNGKREKLDSEKKED